MKTKCLTCVVLALVAIAIQLPAQESESDRKYFELTKAKAEKGDAQAQYNLGVCYANGEGMMKDSEEAVKWLRKAADQNEAAAQVCLGYFYAMGDGVAKDQVESVKWYRKAAEQKNALAQFNLGVCYYNGDGVSQDAKEAVKWWRKAAEQNNALAQFNLGICYDKGKGASRDAEEAVKWWRKAAEQNNTDAQYNLGNCYAKGEGVTKDAVEAVKWYRKAADQNDTLAQCNLGNLYYKGDGVVKDGVEAVKWYRKAAEQNQALAQSNLGVCYATGVGVIKDEVEGYKWYLLAAAQGNENAKDNMELLERRLTREQIAEGQRLARSFEPRSPTPAGGNSAVPGIMSRQPTSSGTGFFISDDGYLITNNHVVDGASQVRLVTSAGLISAKVVKVDAANDLALLKAEGRFAALPVAASRGVKLGGTVATVGFPNIGLQGFAPKLAKGEIASLSGAGDDARYFQISVPVQPGNSGGALVDERGNVVGVVSAKLNASAALRSSGALPENVNYAVKSSYLLSFLESVPDVASKLKEASAKEKKFEEVVKEAEQAAVLVLVY
jgi:TPR repeat protein